MPTLTNHQLDAWRDAALHVLTAGHIPVVPLEIRRRLWRRVSDRELATLLHELMDGEVT